MSGLGHPVNVSKWRDPNGSTRIDVTRTDIEMVSLPIGT